MRLMPMSENEARGGRVVYIPEGHAFYAFPIDTPPDEDA